MERPQAFASDVDAWVRQRPWLVDALFAAALALVLGPTSWALLWGAGWSPAARLAVLALVFIAHLSVAFRRLHPVAAYAVCCSVMLALVIAPDVTGDTATEFAGQIVAPILLPSALVFPVSLYAVAAYSARPWPLGALVVGLAGAVVTTARLWSTDWMAGPAGPPDAGSRLFVLAALLAAVLAPWGLGRFRGVRAAYILALEERAVRAEQQRAERDQQAVDAERARISREMHDVVAHSLAVIVRQAEGGRFAAERDPQLAVRTLWTVAVTGREALADMRAVLGVLREHADGTQGAPQPTVDDVPALVQRVRASGTSVTLSTSGAAGALERATSLAAYRVVQEALTNVVKHAGQDAVAVVRLDWHDSGLAIAITDDGGSNGDRAVAGGVDADGRHDVGGQGLVGMRERVASVGGRLTAGPAGEAGDRGFSIRAHLPTRGPEVTS